MTTTLYCFSTRAETNGDKEVYKLIHNIHALT